MDALCGGRVEVEETRWTCAIEGVGRLFRMKDISRCFSLENPKENYTLFSHSKTSLLLCCTPKVWKPLFLFFFRSERWNISTVSNWNNKIGGTAFFDSFPFVHFELSQIFFTSKKIFFFGLIVCPRTILHQIWLKPAKTCLTEKANSSRWGKGGGGRLIPLLKNDNHHCKIFQLMDYLILNFASLQNVYIFDQI